MDGTRHPIRPTPIRLPCLGPLTWEDHLKSLVELRSGFQRSQDFEKSFKSHEQNWSALCASLMPSTGFHAAGPDRCMVSPGAQREPAAPPGGPLVSEAPPAALRAPTFWALCSSSFRNSEPFSRISMEELRRRSTSSGVAAGPSSPRASSPAGVSARPLGDSLWLLQGPTLFQGTGTASRGGGWPSSGWGWLRGKQQIHSGVLRPRAEPRDQPCPAHLPLLSVKQGLYPRGCHWAVMRAEEPNMRSPRGKARTHLCQSPSPDQGLGLSLAHSRCTVGAQFVCAAED